MAPALKRDRRPRGLAVSFFLIASPIFGGGGTAFGTEGYTVRLTVSAQGFEPRRVPVPLGTVHFVITAREGDHCFAVPSLDVEKRVRVGRPLEVDVTFDRAGEIPFLCCAEVPGSAEKGVLVVAPPK